MAELFAGWSMAFMKQLPAAQLVATPKPRCTLLTMADPVRWDDTKSTDSLHIPKLGCVAVSTMPTQLESDMSG